MNKLEEEREAQKIWRGKKPEVEQVARNMLRREVLDPAIAHDLETRELGALLRFAKSEVPFYRTQKIWSELPLGGSVARDVLGELPILRKHHIHEHFDDLRAQRLPKGERTCGHTSSSGTTGRPTKVLFSRRAGLMYGLLAQRRLRWARFDPTWKQAVIRLPQDFPRRPNGAVLADGEVHRSDGWMYVRHEI